MIKKTPSLRPVVILLLILTMAAILRLQHIRADPPPLLVHLTKSAGIYFDEAMYCHNARNKVLFDKWMMDDWNPLLYNAILTGIYFTGFKLFGISMVTVKIINIIFGLLGVVFLYLAVRRYLSEAYALGLAALLAFDYYWVMYNRIGLLENFTTLFFILSAYFLIKSKEKAIHMVLVGIFVALTVLSKYLYFYFFLAAAIAVVYQAWQTKRWRQVLNFLAGAFAVLAAWFFLIYLPLASSFQKIGTGWMDLSWPETVGKVFFNLYRNNLSRYMSLIPLLFIAGLLFTAMVLVRLWKKNPPPDVLEIFVFLWMAGTFFQMAILNYQPMRYFLNLVPALLFAVSLALKNRDWLRAQARQIRWVFLILGAFFYKFWIGLVIPPSAFFAFNFWPVRILLYMAMVAVFLLWLRRSPRLDRVGSIYILVSLILASFLTYYAHFYRQPVYRLESAARRMSSLPEGSVLMGNEAPRLGLETPFKFFPAFEGWFNDVNPFHIHHPTHLLVLDKFWGGEIVWIRRKFPEIAERMILHKRFPVWDTSISLYKVVYPSINTDIK